MVLRVLHNANMGHLQTYLAKANKYGDAKKIYGIESMPFHNWDQVEKEEITTWVGQKIEGVQRRIITGERLMFVMYDIAPTVKFPPHSHPHEQIGCVLQGKIEFTLGNETKVLGPGDAYVIPPNLPHSSRGMGTETIKILDGFSPIREDFLKKAKP